MQIHQTRWLLPGKKLLGGCLFFAVSHCLHSSGCRAERLLHLQGLWPEQTGQPVPLRQTLATVVVHSWG